MKLSEEVLIQIKFFDKKHYIKTKLNKTVDNLLGFLNSKRDSETRTIRDSSSLEIISGNLDTNNVDDELVVELMLKKVVKIKYDNLESKSDIDKFVKEIRHFCDQAAEIEELKYIPINYRF